MIYTVAPHAGAWIETYFVGLDSLIAKKSRPMRARGLKRNAVMTSKLVSRRAPCGRVD